MPFDFDAIAAGLLGGQSKTVRNLVRQALALGCDPEEILKKGLLKGMEAVTESYKTEKVFVPEVLLAVQAMNAGLDVLERAGYGQCVKTRGSIVIGTVEGDMHDIGKNLVAMMLRSHGFEVYDLGVDVSARRFIEKAEEVNADIICISAMLTTTLTNMKMVIDRLKRSKSRDKYVIMVGGAPVSQNFAKKIGSDYYTDDAAAAVETAIKIMDEKNKMIDSLKASPDKK